MSEAGREITSAFGKVRLWLGLFLLGHGGAMTFAFGWGLPIDLAIDLGSRSVTARVTEVDANTSVKLNKKRATRIGYTYVLDGETHEKSLHTTHPSLTSLRVGASVPVLASTIFPSWSRPAAERNAFFGYLGLLLALEPLVGGPILLLGLLARRRAAAAWTRGVPVPATVVEAGPGRSRVKSGGTSRQSRRVVWSYPWAGGQRSLTLDAMVPWLAHLSPGVTMTVLVDPQNPSSAVPWPHDLPPQRPPAPHGHPGMGGGGFQVSG